MRYVPEMWGMKSTSCRVIHRIFSNYFMLPVSKAEETSTHASQMQ